MIVLPWYVRFTLDCTIVVIPLIYMHYHPCTIFFEYFQNRRRLIRRKCMHFFITAYDDYKYLAEENGPSVAETKTLYKDLGIEL